MSFWALTDFNANKVNYLKLRNVSWVLEYVHRTKRFERVIPSAV